MADVAWALSGDDASDARTESYAGAVAELYAARSRPVDMVGGPLEALRAASELPSVRAVVLPVGPDPPRDTWPPARTCAKPVVLLGRRVPEKAVRMAVGLVPLDGVSATSEALATVLRHLRGGGMRLHALHVFDPDHVPAFWDPAHTQDAWATEFLRRHLEEGVEIDIRRGIPSQEVYDATESGLFDLLVVAWRGTIAAGRGDVVRRCVMDGCVPVMLVPTGTDLPGPSALVRGMDVDRELLS
jgi:hypothetical protein